MAVTLLFTKKRTQLGGITLDAAITEHHGVSVEVTKHPVEAGANISDHRRVQPRSVTVEGVITNTPIPGPTDPQVTQEFNGHPFVSRSQYDPTRAGNAYQDLLDLASSSTLVDVVTTMETYSNMTLSSLDIPRDARTGEAVRFTATFTEIRTVSNATVQVSKTLRGQKKDNKHKKTAPDASAPQVKKTALKVITDKIQTWIGGVH